MDSHPLPYIPLTTDTPALPLGRYLPPLPAGLATACLAQARIAPGAWILDPFGASPALALELALAGYRVLIASNNPILAAMSEVLAAAPQTTDFQAVLAELAATRRGDERLERHILSLYLTECNGCGQPIPASAFLWRRGETQPYARLARCQACNLEDEQPVSPADLERLTGLGNAHLHRARALERVSGPNDDHRPGTEEALQAHLTRPLYVLFNLINKAEGLALSPERRRMLQALLFSVCDEANTLWPWPASRTRPRQLTIPPQFRENNLWLALEEAAHQWGEAGGAPVAFSQWPEQPPPDGGICLYPGRLKTLLPQSESIQPAAAVLLFPRPNQAFWTLSALWSGWMWGREAVLPLKHALERRRYDWQWHANALHSTLSAMVQHSRQGMPVLGILPELLPGFLAAGITAAQAAGLELQGLALREEDELAQLLWKVGGTRVHPGLPPADWTHVCENAIRQHLQERQEPAGYLPLFAAGMTALAQQPNIVIANASTAKEPLGVLQTTLQKSLEQTDLFQREVGSAQNPESGYWWLRSWNTLDMPLADRVEMEVVRYLQKNPATTFPTIDRAICALFPGLLTPSAELVRVCLESYGEALPNETNKWQLSPQETPANRRADLNGARQMLQTLGERLGYTCQILANSHGGLPSAPPLVWHASSGEPVFCFYLLASTLIGRFVFQPTPLPPKRCVLVLPGSRARLYAYKLRHNPHLAQTLSGGWHVLKFRYLRQLSEQETLTDLTAWENVLDGDPPVWEDAVQMQMFS